MPIQTNSQNKAQIVYLSHGGGPLPILGDDSHKAMVEFMRKLPSRLKKPDAILVISAHWEERVWTLLGAEAPTLFYDYYGFPDEAYKINYPANDDFQNWLIDICTGPISQAEREQNLIDWQKAPSARYCHPREEHLLPLHVCLGMAGKAANVIFDDYILGKRALAFLW